MSYEENTNAGTAVYDLWWHTILRLTPVAYSLSGAEDSGKLSIDGTSNGALTFDASPDFEARGSADGDNVYEVTVKAASTDDCRTTATEKSTTVDVTVDSDQR